MVDEEREQLWCVYCKEPIPEGEEVTEPRDGYTVYYHKHCWNLMYPSLFLTDKYSYGKSFFDMDEE